MNKFWNMTSPASPADSESSQVDLWIFGDIVTPDQDAVDKWLGLETGSQSALSIEEAIQNLPADTELTVHINSFGGSVSEGLAIYNVLKSRGNVTTIVEGFACSAASIVFMAGHDRVMKPASLLMLHKPWVATQGNAADLAADIASLEAIEQAMISAYCTSGIAPETAQKLIEGYEGQGTWLTADEALDMNLATSLTESGDDPERAQNSVWKVIYDRMTAPTEDSEGFRYESIMRALNDLRDAVEEVSKRTDLHNENPDGMAEETPTVADMLFSNFSKKEDL